MCDHVLVVAILLQVILYPPVANVIRTKEVIIGSRG
jgi:hypothetical protein